MITPLFILSLLLAVSALPQSDKVSNAPGMPHTVIYSGYLDTATEGRKIHYVFVEANVSQPSNASLAIWLNGGPGCSSLNGMLRQIGPYMVGDKYSLGDQLKKNDYSWTKIANVLFLQSPAIVGFSSDTDSKYHWTDEETARDAFHAIKNFIFNKATQFSNRSLYITGQSYAGKYIPDLANLIIQHNRNQKNTPIALKGIMVGNGVMDFQDNSLEKSQLQYMFDHDLASNRLQSIYHRACTADYKSPRCRFVRFQFSLLEAYLNPYNIYEVCNRKFSQQGVRLLQMLSPNNTVRENGLISRIQGSQLEQIPDCPSDQGLHSYWNLNKIPFHTEKVNKTWTNCAHLNYSITMRGSMDEYRRIFVNKGIRVWLYSGDFDDVVPYPDTEKNVDKFYREKAGGWSPWNIKDQHGGFYQVYDYLTVITVKGAGHMVPQDQPRHSFQLFYNFINNKGVNNQIF